MTYLLVFVGGGLGSLCRFGLGRWLNPDDAARLPWGTLAANVLACLLLGLCIDLLLQQRMDARLGLLVATGFCGGFSTFSTFSLEVLLQLEERQAGLAMTYVALSVLSGLAAVYLGKNLI